LGQVAVAVRGPGAGAQQGQALRRQQRFQAGDRRAGGRCVGIADRRVQCAHRFAHLGRIGIHGVHATTLRCGCVPDRDLDLRGHDLDVAIGRGCGRRCRGDGSGRRRGGGRRRCNGGCGNGGRRCGIGGQRQRGCGGGRGKGGGVWGAAGAAGKGGARRRGGGRGRGGGGGRRGAQDGGGH